LLREHPGVAHRALQTLRDHAGANRSHDGVHRKQQHRQGNHRFDDGCAALGTFHDAHPKSVVAKVPANEWIGTALHQPTSALNSSLTMPSVMEFDVETATAALPP